MRLLNKTEQELCLSILAGHGHDNYLGNIIDNRLQGVSISGKRDTLDVELLFNFWSGGQLPTDQESYNIIQRIEEISLLILETVNLINLLEKDNYILTLQRSPHNDTFKFGGCVGNVAKVSHHFADAKISQLLIEYLQKEIYATEEFRQFCRHGFIARDEQRFRKQFCITTTALVVAIVALLLNTVFNLIPKFSGGTKIKQEQIDNIRSDLRQINSNIDSLNNKAKQTKIIVDELEKRKATKVYRKIKKNTSR